MEAIKEIGFQKSFRYIFFSMWQYVFSLMFVSPMRVVLLRFFGARIGKNTVIERISVVNLYRTGISGISVGNYCFLADGVALDLAEKIILEDHVTLSFDALVLTHTNVGYKDHPVQSHIPTIVKPTIFQKGCFVGARAIILPGITIGEEAAIAAGSVVTKDVPAKILVAGVPAKMVRKFK